VAFQKIEEELGIKPLADVLFCLSTPLAKGAGTISLTVPL
jgi:hypothetical protein